MSGDWIKIEVCLPEKPEVWAMSESLNIDPDAVTGKLIRVWAWFDAHTDDGHAKRVTCHMIDRVTLHPGFAKAMVDVGWLEDSGAGLRQPNFDRHNGESAKKRAEAAQRQAKHRKQKAQDEEKPRNAKSVTKVLPEKRREENILKDKDKEQVRKPKKTGQRLPKNWQPDKELLTWAMTERTDLDIKRVIDSFTDYWIAKTGAAATKLDWDATFRNWVRNEKQRPQARNGTGETPVQRRNREAREAIAQLDGHA